MQYIVNQGDSLFSESKKFQTIRILNVFYSDDLYPRKTKEDELSVPLINRLNEGIEFQNYIDFFLKIENAWQYGKVSFQRNKKDTTLDWTQIDFSQAAYSQPLFIVFGSTFNEDLDNSYRNALQVKLDMESVRLEPISYYAFGQFKKNLGINTIEIQNNKTGLLFFQIADPFLSRFIDNPKEFFRDDMFNKYKITGKDFGIIYYGLLKGDMEGFILFDIKNNESIESLKQYLIECHTGTISNIMPIVLYICSWEHRYNYCCNFDLFSH